MVRLQTRQMVRQLEQTEDLIEHVEPALEIEDPREMAAWSLLGVHGVPRGVFSGVPKGETSGGVASPSLLMFGRRIFFSSLDFTGGISRALAMLFLYLPESQCEI